VLTRRATRAEERVSPADLAAAAYSALTWIVILPVTLLHELAHVLASLSVGHGFKGTGVMLEPIGTLGGRQVYRVRAFFVVHEYIENRYVAAYVSLAPAAFIPLAQLAVETGAPVAVWLLFLLTGLTVISDVLSMAASRAGLDWTDGSTPVFLYGGPDQWQTTLGEYQ